MHHYNIVPTIDKNLWMKKKKFINYWWDSKNAQKARLNICNKHTRSSSTPINDVKKSLNFNT